MTSSDIIAGLAALLSLGSLFYTIYYTNKTDNKNNKKDKLNFIKLLSSSLRQMNYQDMPDEKLLKVGEIRDELTYTSAFDEDSKYIDFSLEFDNKIYLLSQSTNLGDFDNLHAEGIMMLESLKKTCKLY